MYNVTKSVENLVSSEGKDLSDLCLKGVTSINPAETECVISSLLGIVVRTAYDISKAIPYDKVTVTIENTELQAYN